MPIGRLLRVGVITNTLNPFAGVRFVPNADRRTILALEPFKRLHMEALAPHRELGFVSLSFTVNS